MTEEEIQLRLDAARESKRRQYPHKIPKFFKPVFDWGVRFRAILRGYPWKGLKYLRSQRWVEVTREDIIRNDALLRRYENS